MTTRDEIHKGDIGTKLGVIFHEDAAVVDISTATAKKIIFWKPDGTNFTKDGAFTAQVGVDGKIYWQTTLATDLDQVGNWKRQGYIEMGGGTWRSSIIEFEVNENLDD